MLSSGLSWLFGLSGGGKLALIFCIVPLRLFSSANVLLGALVAFRGPFWDAFLIIF